MNVFLSAVFSQGGWNLLSTCKVLAASPYPRSCTLSTPKHWGQLCAATRPPAGTQEGLSRSSSVKTHQIGLFVDLSFWIKLFY